MKTPALLCLAMFGSTVSLRAGPTEAAIVGAMKLTEARNYSWLTDVSEDARSYTLEGKTDLADNKDYSLVTMPMPARRRGPPAPGSGSSRGSSAGEATSTAYFKGDEKYVVETPEGWRTGEEMTNSRSGRGGYGGRGPYGGPGGYGGRGSYPGRSRTGEGERSFSTASLPPSLSRPHEEVAIIIAGYTDLKAEADGVSGTLSEMNAKLLLVRPGQKDVTPLKAAGTFRLWLKDGLLVKYQVKLDGKLQIEGREGRRDVDVHQTATTTLKDVGTTRFDVPEAVKKKLGA